MAYICYINENNYFECALLGLRQFLSTESRLKKIRGLLCPFSKIGKKCPDFGHLWVKFLI